MGDRSIADIIRRQARERGHATAFVTPTRRWTFAEVDSASNRLAQGLASLGIGAGDRVACLTKHHAECALLLLAACKLGAVCMPVNWRLAPPEVEYIVDHGQAKFMMVDEAFLPTLARTRLPGLRLTVATEAAPGLESLAGWSARFDAADPGHVSEPDATTLQLYSSGTTGLPKGVELTNRSLFAAIDMYRPMIGFDEYDGTLAGIQSGAVHGTVVQNPYEYGYQSVKVLHALAGGDKAVVPADQFIQIPGRQIKTDNVEAFWTDLKAKTGK